MARLTFMGTKELSRMPKLMVNDVDVFLWCHGTSKVEESEVDDTITKTT